LSHLGKKRVKEPLPPTARETDPDDYEQKLGEREFKVRIIERLGYLESKLNNNRAADESAEMAKTPCSELLDRLSKVDLSMLDTMGRELILKVLIRLAGKLAGRFDQRKTATMLN